MTFKPWDIVLIPFPFTDLSATKKRPAVVVSSETYNSGQDVMLLFLTSNVSATPRPGDYLLAEWETANLPKPSMIRMKLMTLDKDLILKKLGEIQEGDILKIKEELKEFFGLN